MNKKFFIVAINVVLLIFFGTGIIANTLQDVQTVREDNYYSILLNEEYEEEDIYEIIDGYDEYRFSYCTDFANYYNGACGPVAFINTIKIFEDINNVDIIKGRREREIYKDLVKKFKTKENGGTKVKNLNSGIELFAKEENLDFKPEYIDFNLAYKVRKEINNNRPLILCDVTPGVEHCFVVVGYIKKHNIDSVVVFTGWQDTPYMVVPIKENDQVFIKFKR